jgi:enterochelin esterase-like enzyme
VRTPSLRVVALVFLAATAAVAATAARAHRAESRSAIVDVSFPSQALHKRLIAFYVGNKDWRFRDENLRLDRELNAARVRHVFAHYPGAHEGTVWSAHAKAWLQLATNHLTAPGP